MSSLRDSCASSRASWGLVRAGPFTELMQTWSPCCLFALIRRGILIVCRGWRCENGPESKSKTFEVFISGSIVARDQTSWRFYMHGCCCCHCLSARVQDACHLAAVSVSAWGHFLLDPRWPPFRIQPRHQAGSTPLCLCDILHSPNSCCKHTLYTNRCDAEFQAIRVAHRDMS